MAALPALPASGQTSYSIMVSQSATRSNPSPLAGQTVKGNIYVFVQPETGISKVRFFLDDPQMTRSPRRTERSAPYDFVGSQGNGNAKPFNTLSISDGQHTITAAVDLSAGGTQVTNATFTVNNPNLSISPESLSFTGAAGAVIPPQSITVTSDAPTSASFNISDNAAWLSASPTSGTTPGSVNLTANSTGLAAGTHTATVTASASGHIGDTTAVTLTVTTSATPTPTPTPTPAPTPTATPPPGTYELLLSGFPNRSSATPLDGQSVSGNIYVFVSPITGIDRVRFFIDDPQMLGAPFRIENSSPFDLNGTAADGTALPYDSTRLADGPHNVSAALDFTAGGTQVVGANITVANGGSSLVFTPDAIAVSAAEGGSVTPRTANLAANDGAGVSFSASDDAPWLSVSPASGSTPATLTLSMSTAGLAPGTYNAAVTATSPGYLSDVLPVTLTIGQVGDCTPLPCEEILVTLPYQLTFNSDHGKIPAGNNIGTGFTYVDKPTKGTGYIPGNLAVDTGAGLLRITTTSGLAYTSSNSLDNAIGVGIDAPSQVSLLSTTLVNPPAGTANLEQAGLWFGNNEDNYIKFVTLSTSTGTKIQALMEVNGLSAGLTNSAVMNLASSRVTLRLRTDPADRSVTASFSINGGPQQVLTNFTAPPEFFSFDAAGIDPRIGTRSFGGVFASHRNGPAPLVYSFDDFSVVADTTPGPITPAGVSFNRSSFPVPFPTSLAWGPDNRLYVTELFGTIHAITLNENKQLVSDQVITTLGSRLTLGITVDPLSTPSNVILWVSHSSPSLDNGEANSSTVSRLSGANFSVRQDIITGLPRAIANHAINSIHFGPDGKLYIAQGGNTGAGAPNTANTEFGPMQEQPLSAAILVADVRNPGFDGSCHNAQDIFGPPPCHVVPYATGLRNTYDFVFHRNGSMYASDNGLGVTGTFPPSPAPPCFGFGDTRLWNQGGDNPGSQPDPLNRIVQGKYYGHPNPYRNECVFKDGSYQGVSPLPNYIPPIYDLGMNRSANGTIEYNGDAFCSALDGELLIANYSVGDNITRVKLAQDGLSVVASGNLVGALNDPLPLVEGPDGVIYVGEFGGDLVTALTPVDLGCWSPRAPVPAAVLDAGGRALNGKLYMVGGKTSSGHQTTLYIYDPVQNSWTIGPNLPGVGVENPATAVHNGKLYVFGGSTAAFSGAVNNVAVFDPSTSTWSSLPAMPTARGGATAQELNGLIYVSGGIDSAGGSLATVEKFNPATNQWTAGAAMGTRRDNPGSAVLSGKLYVFGGRTRNADGTTVNGTLNTIEMFDPSTGVWTGKAPMPTGRRTMVVGTLNGRAQLMGGEITGTGGTFPQNEEYDPLTDTWGSLTSMLTPRHGAVAGTINGVVYVAGGGPSGGLTFSTANDAFAFLSPAARVAGSTTEANAPANPADAPTTTPSADVTPTPTPTAATTPTTATPTPTPPPEGEVEPNATPGGGGEASPFPTPVASPPSTPTPTASPRRLRPVRRTSVHPG